MQGRNQNHIASDCSEPRAVTTANYQIHTSSKTVLIHAHEERTQGAPLITVTLLLRCLRRRIDCAERHCSALIALTLKRSYVAADDVLFVWTRLTALIGFQQLALAVGAATWVARVNRRASREESHGRGRSAVVL